MPYGEDAVGVRLVETGYELPLFVGKDAELLVLHILCQPFTLILANHILQLRCSQWRIGLRPDDPIEMLFIHVSGDHQESFDPLLAGAILSLKCWIALLAAPRRDFAVP